jgi:hypothetical protein
VKANKDISEAIEREAAQISANIVGVIGMGGELSTVGGREYRPVMSHHVLSAESSNGCCGYYYC